MKNVNFQLLIFNFQLILLLLFAGCNFNNPRMQIDTSGYLSSFPTSVGELQNALENESISPVRQMQILSELYHKTAQSDTSTAFVYLHQMRSLEQNLSDWLSKAIFYNTMGDYYYKKDSLQKAIDMYDRALPLLLNDNSTLFQNEQAKTLTHKGLIYQQNDDYETAYSLYLEAEKLYLNTENYNRLVNLYGKMSNIFLRNSSDFERHKQILQKANDIIARVTDPDAMVDYYIQQGVVSGNYEEYENSAAFYKQALEILNQTQNLYQLHTVYYNMGYFARVQELYDEAETYYRISLSIAEKSGNKFDICDGNYGLGIILYYQRRFDEAEIHVQKALQIAQDVQSKLLIRNCFSVLGQLEYERDNLKKAFDYYDSYFDYLEELFSIESQSKLAFMAVKYETARKDFEIEQQQNVIARQNMQRWLFIAGIAVCLAFLALLWYMLRLRNHRNTALTERNAALDERNNALSEMNSAKDKFFNIISHDLKNPAVALLDSLKLLVENGRAWDADTLTKYYAELLHSAEGHVELIYGLLDWTRVQTGRMTYTPEPFFLAARLRFNVSQVRDIATKKGVTLINTIPDDAFVEADANILTTVVRNLLTNAVKFTPAGGAVTLSAVAVDCRDGACPVSTGEQPADAANKYIISISDTGIGMTPEQISNLFCLDSAQSRSGTAGEQGTGLGLIVCRDLLEKHGSTLHVESAEGTGSTFSFEI